MNEKHSSTDDEQQKAKQWYTLSRAKIYTLYFPGRCRWIWGSTRTGIHKLSLPTGHLSQLPPASTELPGILIRTSPGAARSAKLRTEPMGVTRVALLSPGSESKLRNTVKALWLHPLCHAKCYPPPPSTPVCVISDGHELQRQSQTGAMRQVLSQPAGVGQGAHVLSTVVLSQPCGRSNIHRAQKTLKGKAGKRREGRRR